MPIRHVVVHVVDISCAVQVTLLLPFCCEQGQPVVPDATLASVSLRPGEFLVSFTGAHEVFLSDMCCLSVLSSTLNQTPARSRQLTHPFTQVALPLGKHGPKEVDPRKGGRPQRTVSDGHQHTQPATRTQAEAVPGRTASSPAATAAEGPTCEGSPLPPSRPSTPPPEGFSLLPGYNSRPNISPVKEPPPPPATATAPAGGGFCSTLHAHAQHAAPASGAQECSRRSGSLEFPAAAPASPGQEAAASRSGSGSAARQVSAWAASGPASPQQNPHRAQSIERPAQDEGVQPPAGRAASAHTLALWEELSREMASAPVHQPETAAVQVKEAAAAVPDDAPDGEGNDAASAPPRKRPRRAPPRRPPKPKFQVSSSVDGELHAPCFVSYRKPSSECGQAG